MDVLHLAGVMQWKPGISGLHHAQRHAHRRFPWFSVLPKTLHGRRLRAERGNDGEFHFHYHQARSPGQRHGDNEPHAHASHDPFHCSLGGYPPIVPPAIYVLYLKTSKMSPEAMIFLRFAKALANIQRP